MVTLYCNATGKPAPNINWTRVWENGTDSEQLPVVDGSYVMSNIKRSSSGTYRCTAYNGVGNPVNRTVKVIVRCKYERKENFSSTLRSLLRKLVETSESWEFFTSLNSIGFENNGNEQKKNTWDRVSAVS